MIKKTETAPPTPDLQELVARFGPYYKITPEAWPEYDAAIETHRAWLRRLTPEDQRAMARRFITNALASSPRKIHLAAESAVLTFAQDEVAAALEWALGAIRTGASVSRHGTRRSYFGFPPRELGVKADVRLIRTAFFRKKSAATLTARDMSLEGLCQLILGTDAATKDKLPWLKLATFGGDKSDKGSLRHDANVASISGIEADYDDEEMPFEAAIKIVEAARANTHQWASNRRDEPTARLGANEGQQTRSDTLGVVATELRTFTKLFSKNGHR
jgi:hypothetical protein